MFQALTSTAYSIPLKWAIKSGNTWVPFPDWILTPKNWNQSGNHSCKQLPITSLPVYTWFLLANVTVIVHVALQAFLL